jgi:hypothetical protein
MVGARSMPQNKPAGGWLLLIHQIPPKPNYFRAKVGRRLQRVGAVAIKNSVYALPFNDQTQEDLQWIAREITQEGGEATLCKASFVEGLRDEQVESFFQTARDADYTQVGDEARDLIGDLPKKLAADDERRTEWEGALARLKKRLTDIAAIDFFGASGRLAAESAVASLEKRLDRDSTKESDHPAPKPSEYRGRTWITRKNIHVDRIASAWLIRRFIDAKATFKFVANQGYRPKDDEVGFDMFEAEFTHEGDKCSFEVLVERFSVREPGIKTIAEIVHDIDIKDGKFKRAEVPGIADVIASLGLAHRTDEARLEAGMVLFDNLLDLYRRKRN